MIASKALRIPVMLRIAARSAKITMGTHIPGAILGLPDERTFIRSPLQRQKFTAGIVGTTSPKPAAHLHCSTALSGVKKLPVDDDVLITRQQAKDLIYRLHQKERRILLEELERYNTLNDGE